MVSRLLAHSALCAPAPVLCQGFSTPAKFSLLHGSRCGYAHHSCAAVSSTSLANYGQSKGHHQQPLAQHLPAPSTDMRQPMPIRVLLLVDHTLHCVDNQLQAVRAPALPTVHLSFLIDGHPIPIVHPLTPHDSADGTLPFAYVSAKALPMTTTMIRPSSRPTDVPSTPIMHPSAHQNSPAGPSSLFAFSEHACTSRAPAVFLHLDDLNLSADAKQPSTTISVLPPSYGHTVSLARISCLQLPTKWRPTDGRPTTDNDALREINAHDSSSLSSPLAAFLYRMPRDVFMRHVCLGELPGEPSGMHGPIDILCDASWRAHSSLSPRIHGATLRAHSGLPTDTPQRLPAASAPGSDFNKPTERLPLQEIKALTFLLSIRPIAILLNLRNSVSPTAIGRSIQHASLLTDISICKPTTSLPGKPLLTSATICVSSDSSTLEFLCNHKQAGQPLTFPGGLSATTYYSYQLADPHCEFLSQHLDVNALLAHFFGADPSKINIPTFLGASPHRIHIDYLEHVTILPLCSLALITQAQALLLPKCRFLSSIGSTATPFGPYSADSMSLISYLSTAQSTSPTPFRAVPSLCVTVGESAICAQPVHHKTSYPYVPEAEGPTNFISGSPQMPYLLFLFMDDVIVWQGHL
ncbi:hypothetical protein KP509_31G031200 [Ceratopteris richardii]|uniref:Uncharacterized protein n=1 Tax=Ceratopteris richardii TaxID=49495 RepID=A0A8T2QXG8_CERRI|nr:hypothetical protein KP509_31G031200 [Ceratopteris richardii]